MCATSVVRSAPYPAMLDLDGRRVLCVGGGGVAARKARAVLDAGAQLLVVAPWLGAQLAALVAAGEVDWEERVARAGDTDGVVLVICATGDRAANAAIAAEARAARVPVVVADDPAAGSFSVPASLRRGGICIAVSTGARSPSLAAFIRGRLEEAIGEEYSELAELAEMMRVAGRAAGVSRRERDRRGAAAFPRLLELLRQGRGDEARALAASLATAPVEERSGSAGDPAVDTAAETAGAAAWS